jgi:hypothetical protein
MLAFPGLLTKREMKRLAEEGKDRYVVDFKSSLLLVLMLNASDAC